MPTKKTKSPPLYSVNALSKITGRDRRTLDKIIVGVVPAGKVRGSKAYRLEDVEKAMAAKPDKGLREQKISEEIRKLRIRNDKDDGKLVPAEWVMEGDARILSRVDQILEQKLSNEYPSAVAGLDVPQARVYGKRLGDQIRAEFHKLKEERKR